MGNAPAFASADNAEDLLTVAYLRDTAEQAGLPTHQLLMEEIGWNEPRQCFVDLDPKEHQIQSIFKLYPWETMLEEEFAQQWRFASPSCSSDRAEEPIRVALT